MNDKSSAEPMENAVGERVSTDEGSCVGGWISPILVVGFTIFWVLLIYAIIGVRSRDWEFGATPYVPGASVFSTEQPERGKIARQVELPIRPAGGPSAKQ